MRKISITHMSNAHSGWLRSLDFYKSELKYLKTRLTEIGSRNTSKDVTKQLEKFENKLKVHGETIDKLAHNIRENTTEAAREAHDSSAGYINKKLVTQHNKLEDDFESEEKDMNDLRHDFNRFASEWM